MGLSYEEEGILVQYAIKKYKNENIVVEKIGEHITAKRIRRHIDTLIGTQKVRRIGSDTLENNESHTDMPELPDSIKSIVDSI